MPTAREDSRAFGFPPPRAAWLQAVRLEEGPQGLRDLEVALFAEHEPVVGMGTEVHVRVEPTADHEPRDVGQRRPIDRDAGQHLALRAPGLERLLTEQVLDAED